MIKHGTANITAFRLTPGRAQELIRAAAQKSSTVIISEHAKTQMKAREIDSHDVFRILRGGMVTDAPEKTQDGEWKCKVVMRIKGNRDVGVVTIILTDNSLFVKTVMWEDLS